MAVYFPDEQLADGAAEAESRGFFDVRDTPAWDTWIGLYVDRQRGDYLVSWVPNPLIPLVGLGISVNPMDCIAWLRAPEASP